MPEGIGAKEERLYQERIAASQSKARADAARGFEAAHISSMAGTQTQAAQSQAQQEMMQQETLAAQVAMTARAAAQQAAAQQQMDTMVTQAAIETEEAMIQDQMTADSVRHFHVVEKRLEKVRQFLTDRMENLAESTGESFVLSGAIYIALAIWVVLRVFRTFLIKSKRGFMGFIAAVVAPYEKWQMYLALVAVAVTLLFIAGIFGLAFVIVGIAWQESCEVLSYIPDAFEDMILKMMGKASIPCP